MDQLYRRDTGAMTDDELAAILYAIIKHFSKVYLFLDGLDECREEVQATVLSIVIQLFESIQPVVKIFISSRDEYLISKSLKEFPHIQISAENNSDDIALFVEETVKSNIRSGALKIQDPCLESEVISALTNQAHGMSVAHTYRSLAKLPWLTYYIRFLWVHFQLADLCDTVSDFGIRKVLQNLPDGMAATYARAVQKIGQNPVKMNLAQQIFKWIACAKRPLLMAELAEAIAFGPSDASWDSTKIPDASRLIQACGHLAVLDDDGTARFAHHTVQQFLIGLPLKDSISEFHFDLSKADAGAGEVCITYLLFSDFEKQITISRPNNLQQENNFPSPKAIVGSVVSGLGTSYAIHSMLKLWTYLDFRNLKSQSPTIGIAKITELKKPPPPDLGKKYQLLNYALENWLMHTSMIAEDDILWNKFKHLAMDKHTSFDIRPWGNSDASNRLPHMGLFRWAVDAGHVPLLKLLLKLPRGPDLHAYCRQVSEEGQSIATNALLRGHKSMIKLLANQNCIDTTDGRPLLSLATAGNDSAVRLLLELELCVDAKIEALHIATESEHAAVIHILLENDPPLDLQDGWGKLALANAAKRYSDEVLAVLLRKAANFKIAITDVRNVWDNDVLLEAAKRGMDKLVKQLLTTDSVDPDSKNRYGRTPLSWAAENGHEAVVKQLLAMDGIDLDSKDKYGRTPLSWAAEKGCEAVVRQLLATGSVNPDFKDTEHGQTPLFWAAANGHKAVVKQLLATDGVDPDSKDRYGQTPLLWAAVKGHEAVVKQLLATDGVDPDSKNTLYRRTPLSWAAENGHEAVVKQLLAMDGVDPDSKDTWCGRTPLSWAAENGHEAVVKQLLATDGVDPDSRDTWYGRTPLSWVAESGHEAVVKQLLATDGVDPNSKDTPNSWTPLSWAAVNGHEAVVKQLLAADGVDPNSKDTEHGWTPLSWAAANGLEAVVKQLLETDGVDPDSKDKYGRTPLSRAAANGHEAVVKQLLATDGVDLDSKDTEYGWTPLSWAAEKGHEAVVKLLELYHVL
jgi:ankyrin repeat protein